MPPDGHLGKLAWQNDDPLLLRCRSHSPQTSFAHFTYNPAGVRKKNAILKSCPEMVNFMLYIVNYVYF